MDVGVSTLLFMEQEMMNIKEDKILENVWEHFKNNGERFLVDDKILETEADNQKYLSTLWIDHKKKVKPLMQILQCIDG